MRCRHEQLKKNTKKQWLALGVPHGTLDVHGALSRFDSVNIYRQIMIKKFITPRNNILSVTYTGFDQAGLAELQYTLLFIAAVGE
jgi:hypothetical protein